MYFVNGVIDDVDKFDIFFNVYVYLWFKFYYKFWGKFFRKMWMKILIIDNLYFCKSRYFILMLFKKMY